MNTVKIKAYAKINLTLDVTGVSEGYHLLDSFVASISLYDLLVVRKRKDKLVSVTMHGMDSKGIPPESNNAFRAGEAFVRRFSTTGADITVYKNIPMGAGLGGGVRSGNICGAVNAPVMILGCACPEMAGSKAKAAEITKEFQRRFTERFRHLNCRELLAEKELQPTDTALELAAGDHCGLLILSAAEILCGMIGEK